MTRAMDAMYVLELLKQPNSLAVNVNLTSLGKRQLRSLHAKFSVLPAGPSTDMNSGRQFIIKSCPSQGLDKSMSITFAFNV